LIQMSILFVMIKINNLDTQMKAYKDLEMKEPCKIGDTVAVYIQDDGLTLMQEDPLRRPTYVGGEFPIKFTP